MNPILKLCSKASTVSIVDKQAVTSSLATSTCVAALLVLICEHYACQIANRGTLTLRTFPHSSGSGLLERKAPAWLLPQLTGCVQSSAFGLKYLLIQTSAVESPGTQQLCHSTGQGQTQNSDTTKRSRSSAHTLLEGGERSVLCTAFL